MSSNYVTTTLKIVNMTCVNCENHIEHALTGIEGIISVKSSYSAGTATVTYDAELISVEKMEEILALEDYFVKKETSLKNTEGYADRQSENQTTNAGSNQTKNQTINRKESQTASQAAKRYDFSDLISTVIIIFALYIIARRFGLLNIFNVFPTAKDGMGYGMLFIIGILTSVHCVAMCGGICLSQCVPKQSGEGVITSKFAAMRPSLLYNFGRVISYTVIGGIVGAIGSVVSFSGPMKGLVQILAGVFMVIMGLNMLNIFPWLRKFNPRMPKIFAKKIYAQRSSNSPLYIGLLNGLMPCGPLQAMQLYALSTGSPLKGAISMFLFSVGTVPLMFAFGALSSLLSKKFTTKMMSASAVLVVVLGVFMFNSGVGLSGFAFPTLPVTASTSKSANVAVIEDGVQVVRTGLTSGRYEPITVQKGIPVKWIIEAENGEINGCNNSIVVPRYNLQKDLAVGENIIEFTPTDSGVIPYSCWMGMIRSKITVVDDLSNVGQTVASTSDGTGDTASTDNSGYSDNSSGIESFDNLLDVEIPTDELAIAKVEGEKQTVEITMDENGFSPAVVVVQSGLETEWNIKVNSLGDTAKSIIFPYYNAELLVEGIDNPISFYPDYDFDFYTSGGIFYGYVKVVEDINNIDLEAIKKEVSEYRPSDPSAAGLDGGAGLPSCH